MRYSKNKVSIIIPAKNEAEGLRKILTSLKPYSTDIIVVDGHSTDSTKEITEEFGARYYLDNEAGMGDALKIGIKKAKNDFLVFFDSDSSHSARDIPSLVTPLIHEGMDAVMGSRRTGGSFELNLNFWGIIRSMGSDFAVYLINKRFSTNYSDILFSFRAIKKTVAKDLKLKSNGFEIEEEMVIKLLKQKYKLKEIPIKEYERAWGKTKSHYTDAVSYIYCLIKELYI